MNGGGEKFNDAVQIAKNTIEETIEAPDFEQDPVAKFVERYFVGGFSSVQIGQIILEDMSEQSETDVEIRRLLKLRIARTLEKNIELSDIERIWLFKHLKGELPRPTRRRGRPKKYVMDTLIYHTVQDLVDYHELNPTRNEASPETSASDAVAKALHQLGEVPNSYDRVRKIWQKKPGIRIYADE